MELLEQLAYKVQIGDDCWEWTASKDNHGYGQVNRNGRPRKAHRLMYELLVGLVPPGLELDHLCRNPACVRPDHLEAVTHRENIRRAPKGKSGAWQLAKTHCPKGHPYDEANTYLYRGERQCRACHRDRQRERVRRARADREG